MRICTGIYIYTFIFSLCAFLCDFVLQLSFSFYRKISCYQKFLTLPLKNNNINTFLSVFIFLSKYAK